MSVSIATVVFFKIRQIVDCSFICFDLFLFEFAHVKKLLSVYRDGNNDVMLIVESFSCFHVSLLPYFSFLRLIFYDHMFACFDY